MKQFTEWFDHFFGVPLYLVILTVCVLAVTIAVLVRLYVVLFS